MTTETTPADPSGTVGAVVRPDDVEESAFRMFARIRPHEAHDLAPDRFWAYFQTQCPGVERAAMVAMLRETDEGPNASVEGLVTWKE